MRGTRREDEGDRERGERGREKGEAKRESKADRYRTRENGMEKQRRGRHCIQNHVFVIFPSKCFGFCLMRLLNFIVRKKCYTEQQKKNIEIEKHIIIMLVFI